MALTPQLYVDLARVESGSPLWTWPHSHFAPPQIGQLGPVVPKLANTLFNDYLQRPLGILLVRLMWELGVISHEGGEQGGNLSVLAPFIDGAGNVNIRFSVRTPWEFGEVEPSVVDDFLTATMVVGDGLPIGATYPEGSQNPWGVSIQRYLTMTSRDLRSPAGRALWRPRTVEPREMVFAFTDGDTTLRLVNVGKPEFDEKAFEGLTPVHPVLPFAGFPIAFEREDGSRFYLPGSEGGAELNMTGYAFTQDGRQEFPLAGRLETDGRPVIRVHMEYSPGWEFACGGVYAWSEIGEGTRKALRERFAVIEG